MNTNIKERRVDQNELRTNYFFIVVLMLTGYLTDRWELVALQAAFFLLTTTSEKIGPYNIVYRMILRPLGIIKPDWRDDNIEAHRFTRMIAAIVSFAAAYCLNSGYTAVGWGLVGVVATLATIAFIGWCAGCFMYYMIQKTGVKGFFRYAPVTNGFPGVRPPK